MKILFSFFFMLTSALFPQSALAHSSLVSLHKIQQNQDDTWTLTINIPLHKLHASLLKMHSEKELINEDNDYNTKLAVKYFLEQSSITINGHQKISMKSISTNIDNHNSSFTFLLQGLAKKQKVKTIGFNFKSMSDHKGHANITRIITHTVKRKVVLNAQNNFIGHIDL